MSSLTAIDLFCGAGGLSHGFQQAGYEVLLGSDIEAAYGQTFVASHPGTAFLATPIQDLTLQTLSRTVGVQKGELDVLLGGPPCQGYSVYNHDRGEHDPRAGLFREYLRLVDGLRPKYLVMENVTGLLSISSGTLIKRIRQEIEHLGYNVGWAVLRAEDYGVPQERRRVVFVANRSGMPVRFPAVRFGVQSRPYNNVWDAIGDLPPIWDNSISSGTLSYACSPMNDFQQSMRQHTRGVINHRGPRLSAVNQARLKFIPQGGSWRDIPHDLLPAGMQRAKRSDHTKRYGRPRPTDLASTILTKCDIHWGAYIHPVQNRAFTVREAARLQSFPDNFEFHGSMTEQFVQVGNAVPPMLARAIAEQIAADLNNSLLPLAA